MSGRRAKELRRLHPDVEQIQVNVPSGCNLCGTKGSDLIEKYGGVGFVVIDLKLSGVIFFACPVCNCVQVNTNAMENVRTINKKMDSKIVRATVSDITSLKDKR